VHIVQVSSYVLPVSKYGGIERITYYLCDELIKLGHKVSLVCPPGSYHENPKVEVIHCEDVAHIQGFLPEDMDIVHFHIPALAKQQLSVPYIVTLHGNLRSYKEIHGLKNLVGISYSHMVSNRCGRFVYNGLPSSNYTFVDDNDQDNFIYLSAITPKAKGVSKAIFYSTLLREKLNVAGGFRKDIYKRFPIATALSLFNGTKFFGEVDDIKKQNLLSKAKALLFPIGWQEPFGLVMIEALFCGTPVIGFNYGSVPEVIKPEVGFVVNKRRAFLEAMSLIHTIDRKKCRDYAVRHFDSSVMAKKYLACYQDIISGQTW